LTSTPSWCSRTLLTTANAYIGYRYVVFRSTRSVGRELRRFVAVYALTLAVNLVVLPLALHLLPWNVYVIQGLFTGIVVLLSHLGHEHFTFRRDASGQED
jgi:putative flippase GtrA